MKKTFALSALAFMFAANSFAASLNQAAPSLKQIQVTSVSDRGSVLKTKKVYPNSTEIVVGIPVEVLADSACTQFVGQSSQMMGGIIQINAIGSYSVLSDVCIAVMPRPVETQFTFRFVLGNLPVAVLNAPVQIGGRNYVVTLELATERVTIQPR